MPKPAVLIGIGDVQWHTATGKQYGDMDVEVTVYLERGEETYAGAEGGAEALEKLSWQDRIYEKLEGQSGKNWQDLTRRQSRRAEWGAREVKLGSVWRCTVVQARPSRDVEVRSVELKVEK